MQIQITQLICVIYTWKIERSVPAFQIWWHKATLKYKLSVFINQTMVSFLSGEEFPLEMYSSLIGVPAAKT